MYIKDVTTCLSQFLGFVDIPKVIMHVARIS